MEGFSCRVVAVGRFERYTHERSNQLLGLIGASTLFHVKNLKTAPAITSIPLVEDHWNLGIKIEPTVGQVAYFGALKPSGALRWGLMSWNCSAARCRAVQINNIFLAGQAGKCKPGGGGGGRQ